MIVISPIQSYQILGLDNLLVGRRARYLIEFSNRAGYNKESCSINYRWIVKN